MITLDYEIINQPDRILHVKLVEENVDGEMGSYSRVVAVVLYDTDSAVRVTFEPGASRDDVLARFQAALRKTSGE